MKTLKARLNWGRWIVDCPKEDGGALEVVPNVDKLFVCPVCYPQSIASHVGMIGGRIANVPDVSARRTGKALAEANDEVYSIEYPEGMERIVELVGKRPQQNRNWQDGETLAFLQQENDTYLPKPPRRRKNAKVKQDGI